MKKIWMMLCAVVAIAVFNGCDIDNVFQKSKIVEVKSYQDIGSVGEYVCDIEIWQNKLWIAPYLNYTNLKIYGHDLGGNGIHVAYAMGKKFESVYRLWKNPTGSHFSFSTEQPPEWYQRSVTDQWVCKEHYNDKGWALLGDTLSDGIEVRGWSNYGKQPFIKRWHNNTWILMNPQISQKRIVWMMENFNGSYYAMTSWSDGYREKNCGNVYRWDFDKWTCVRGNDCGVQMGGAMCCLTAGDKLFVGTRYPQQILTLDEDDDWSLFHISEGGDEEGVYSIWKDDDDHIFAGAYTSNSIIIYQRNLKNEKWEIIWTKATEGHENRWGMLGVCNGNNEMYIAYRFRSGETRIGKLTYEEN